MSTAPAIQDHALVGDGRSTALVARDGSVDWLCWPEPQSPALLGALLDPEGGRLRIAPRGARGGDPRYLEDTNVLVTAFEAPGGALRLLDLMPIGPEDRGGGTQRPEHELLRIAECTRGEVEVEVEADLRPGFGLERRRARAAGPLGLRLEQKAGLVTLRASAPLALGADGVARGRATLRRGESMIVSLAWDTEAPAALPPLESAWDRLRETSETWRGWARRLAWEGPGREPVVRSALALKLLAYAPTGAILAAPTTSLPERPGGDLNWDYRFCWLRDAALTVSALYGLGCAQEAEVFAGWLLHATRLTHPELRVLYDVFGRPPPREQILPHLAGHGGARPVRVGNAAAEQVQLDVYGEVVDAVAQVVRRGVRLDRETQAMLRGFGEVVCRTWRTPESGIWEPREPPRLRTHSLVLAWVALERLLELGRRGAIERLPAERLARERDAIRRRVQAEGWSEHLGSYVGDLGGGTVDAALLLLAWYGFDDPRSPRMQGTWRRIRERLGAGPGLLYRYEASRAVGEGAFGICSFWAAEFLARGGGSAAEARAWLEALLAHASPAGLWGEEIDPRTGAALGNFPQAFTHVGLVGAALALAARERAEPRARGGVPSGEGMPR